MPTVHTRRLLSFVALAAAVLASLAMASPARAATVADKPSTVSWFVRPAGTVVPDTGQSCGTGASSGNVETCMLVNGSGLHVNFAQSSAQVLNAARTLQSCIRGPQGTIGCTPFVSVAVGDAIGVLWSPNATEPGGDYCANTWRLNSDGSHTEIGHQCVNVHS